MPRRPGVDPEFRRVFNLVSLIALLAFFLHHFYFCFVARSAISASYPNHPELGMFKSMLGPIGMVILLASFRSIEVIHRLPDIERTRIQLHYRMQLALALVFAAAFVGVLFWSGTA